MTVISLSERIAARRRQLDLCERCGQSSDHQPMRSGPGLLWHAGPDFRGLLPEWLRRGVGKDFTPGGAA